MADTGECILHNDPILVPDNIGDVLPVGIVDSGVLLETLFPTSENLIPDVPSDTLPKGYTPEGTLVSIEFEELVVGDTKVGV